ncbi:hypothetical protein BDD12DRAFT_266959 [Trichophaea hybrida]|nr:hypothetical protein BDD12DRAFT_266959 [Trichophaea hybrida]
MATSNNKKDRRKDILEDLAHNETLTSLRLSDKDRKEILEDLTSKLSEEVHNHPKDSVGALMKLVDLGNAVADLGKAKDAVEYYNQALEGFERIVGNDLHPIPDILMNLATVYYEQREYENAVRHHRRSFTGYAKASDQVWDKRFFFFVSPYIAPYI